MLLPNPSTEICYFLIYGREIFQDQQLPDQGFLEIKLKLKFQKIPKKLTDVFTDFSKISASGTFLIALVFIMSTTHGMVLPVMWIKLRKINHRQI